MVIVMSECPRSSCTALAGDLVDVEVAWGIADAHRKLTARASDTPRSTYGVATLINMAGMLGPRRSFDDALINWNFANVGI